MCQNLNFLQRPLTPDQIKQVKERLEKKGWQIYNVAEIKKIYLPPGNMVFFNLNDAAIRQSMDDYNPNFPPKSKREYLQSRGWRIPESACDDPDLKVCRLPGSSATFTLPEAMKEQLELDMNRLHENEQEE